METGPFIDDSWWSTYQKWCDMVWYGVYISIVNIEWYVKKKYTYIYGNGNGMVYLIVQKKIGYVWFFVRYLCRRYVYTHHITIDDTCWTCFLVDAKGNQRRDLSVSQHQQLNSHDLIIRGRIEERQRRVFLVHSQWNNLWVQCTGRIVLAK